MNLQEIIIGDRVDELERILDRDRENGKVEEEIDEEGFRPLHLASFVGSEKIVKSLLNRSACVNAKTKNNVSPLQLACIKGHTVISRILIQHHAAINSIAQTDWTALHLASTNGHVDCVELLIDCKANINASRKPLGTPLHVATHSGFHHVVSLLLVNLANPYIMNDLYQTPIEVSEFDNITKRLRETMEKHPPSFYEALPPMRRKAPVRKVPGKNEIEKRSVKEVEKSKSQPILKRKKKSSKQRRDTFNHPPPKSKAPPPPIAPFSFPPPDEPAPLPPQEFGYGNNIIGSATLQMKKDRDNLKKLFGRKSMYMDPRLFLKSIHKSNDDNEDENSQLEDEEEDEEESIEEKKELSADEIFLRDCFEQTEWFKVALKRKREKAIVGLYQSLYPKYRELSRRNRDKTLPGSDDILQKLQSALNICEMDYGDILPSIEGEFDSESESGEWLCDS